MRKAREPGFRIVKLAATGGPTREGIAQAPGGDCAPGGGVRDAPCDGRALWGIIGLVTLTSPALIAVFHPWLKDSGDGDGDAIHGPGGAMKYEELDPIGIEEREIVDDDSDGDDPKIELVDMTKPSSEAAV